MAPKRTQGRKKIVMKMIANENARRVTFSKRRQGLFKKGSELSTLCGVDMALVVFSQAGKPFSFGSPSVNPVVDRFMNRDEEPNNEANPRDAVARQGATVHQLNQQLMALKTRLEVEKGKNHDGYVPFSEYISQLDANQLEELKRNMAKLKKNLHRRVDELLLEGPSNPGQEEGVPNTELLLGGPSNLGQEEGVPNAEKKDGDGDGPIPQDWLKL